MPDSIRPQLGRLLALPLATIGVLAAILVWELEHVGSVPLGAVILASAVFVGVLVAHRVSRWSEELSEYYASLLRAADEASRRAESANQLKDEFLATLSHELRTPLNSILGWSRLLASDKLGPGQSHHALEAIERAAWTQSRLVDDLLDVSRIVNGTMALDLRPVRVQPLVTAAVDALRPAADAKNLAIETAIDPEIGAVSIDPDRVRQIVWNLLSNAIKFTPAGGLVRVGVVAQTQHVAITVADSGIGLTPDVAAHLFERFRQGDTGPRRQYGGLGLGLGIVRHLVELHGGTVSAESAGENHGTTFRVELPRRAVEEPQVSPAASQPAPALNGVSVLVVDDDRQVLQMVRTTLEAYGATVDTADKARDALDRLTHRPPDVLVSDLIMPDEDGIALIRQVRALDAAHGGRTPAAALTALTRSDDRRRALDAGYQVHITKPIDPLELASTIEYLVRTRLERSA